MSIYESWANKRSFRYTLNMLKQQQKLELERQLKQQQEMEQSKKQDRSLGIGGGWSM